MRTHTRLNLEVKYSAPIFRGRRVLRVLPLALPNQMLLAGKWRVFPEADLAIEKADENGNRRLFLRHQKIESVFHLELDFEALNAGSPISEPSPNIGRWKMPSRAVIFGGELQKVANDFKYLPVEERVAKFGEICFERIQYTSKNSSKPVPANEIWSREIGTCADFSHLFITLCRMSGLPARYVAGYCVGEGQMHAWSEFWHQGQWIGFDATHNRFVGESYIAVAKGRDFYDCAPHEGSFFGDAQAELTLFCRTHSLQD